MVSLSQSADMALGKHMSSTDTKAADKIAADMKLMRTLFLEAVGPKQANGNGNGVAAHLPSNVPAATPDSAPTISAMEGAPRLTAEVADLLASVEATPADATAVAAMAPIVQKIEKMEPATLLQSSQLLVVTNNFAEIKSTVFKKWESK